MEGAIKFSKRCISQTLLRPSGPSLMPPEDYSTNSKSSSSSRTSGSTIASHTDQDSPIQKRSRTLASKGPHTQKAPSTDVETLEKQSTTLASKGPSTQKAPSTDLQTLERLKDSLQLLPFEVPTLEEIRRDEDIAYEVFGQGGKESVRPGKNSAVMTPQFIRDTLDELESWKSEAKNMAQSGPQTNWTLDELRDLEKQQVFVLDAYEKNEGNMNCKDNYSRKLELKKLTKETRARIQENVNQVEKEFIEVN